MGIIDYQLKERTEGETQESLFQEVLNDFPFSNFLKQVDGKNWRLHLLLCNREMIRELMITERSKQKRQSQIDPAFSLLKLYIDLLLKFISAL